MRPAGWAQHALGLGQAASSRLAQFFTTGGREPAPGASWAETWLRPKGNISGGTLSFLLIVGLLPLASVALRILALPGILGPGTSGTLLPAIGHGLSQVFSLHDIPPGDRHRVLYILFLPTGALMIALARLTFGIRLIGFRSILISVGFQQSGIVPSMLLIAAMISVVIGVRPSLMKMRLPYFARVAVIMSLSVIVLLCSLMLAPWLRSDVLWGVAFFPVIVLGLLAEGIAKAIDKDSGLAAVWRATMTIGIALVLAGISHIPIVREIAIEFPELVVTQIVAIILIAEFLDLRLLQDWDARLSGVALPRLFSGDSALRIAVIRNRKNDEVIGRIGAPSRGGYRRRTVRRIVDCLRRKGHSVKVFEGDISLLSELRSFIPTDPLTRQPGGIALNLSHGIQGDASVAHVPAMLELSGIAYTGPTPSALMLSIDRIATTAVLREAGIPTVTCTALGATGKDRRQLYYPLAVKPRIARNYKLRIARNRQQLDEALTLLAERHQHDAVVEPYLEGREFDVPVLGNSPAECLPLVEVLPGNEERRCPAVIDAGLAHTLRATALGAFRACACRDYAVINLRLSATGQPLVLEVRVAEVLERGDSFDVAACAAGLSFDDLVEQIVTVARDRYRPLQDLANLPAVYDAAIAGRGKGRTLIAQ
jgi:D-alanine-D-alanine ligase